MKTNVLQHLPFLFFWTILAIVFGKIADKAIHIPMAHDEVATAVHYYKFSTWDIMMFPDNWPNNHILNTLSAKFLISIFGRDEWVVRLPNLLSFLLLAAGLYRLAKRAFPKGSYLVMTMAALFVSNPYFLDFFGLCRGYGMSCGWVVLSASYLVSGFSDQRERDIWWAVIFAILASYANFTALVFWAATTILAGLFFVMNDFHSKKTFFIKIAKLSLLSIAYFALIITPIRKMTSTDQFKYWESGGFYKETISSLTSHWQYGTPSLFGAKEEWLPVIVLGIIILSLSIIVFKAFFIKNDNNVLQSPLAITTLLLCLTAAINIIQSWLLGTPNLNGRTAIFFFPLFALVVSMLFAEIAHLKTPTQRNWSHLVYLKPVSALLLSTVFLYHFFSKYSPNETREWWYDGHTLNVLDVLDEERDGESISLKTWWSFHPSFFYYMDTGKTPWLEVLPYERELNPDTTADYYYVFENEMEIMPPDKFIKIYKFGNDKWLMRRVGKDSLK